MKVEIVGTGCRKCKATEKVIKEVVEELGIDADIVKVEGMQEIMERGVAITPSVVVDGDVKISGHVPSEDEVRKQLRA